MSRVQRQNRFPLALIALGATSAGVALAQNGAPYARAGATSQPALFAAGRISTGDMELNAAFTPDGKAVYFTKRSPKPQFWAIVVSHYRAGTWTEPEIAPFSGQFNDFDPFVSPDGTKLFFSSGRPIDATPKEDFDIWVVERTATGWGAPHPVGTPVNSKANEFYPTVAADGTLYFSSTRSGGLGSGDIYQAKLVEGDPYIAPDGSWLVFVSYGRPGGQGDGDLYLSFHRDGAWSTAVNLGAPINSSALDFCPIVSPDGKYLFFTSERGFADQPRQSPLTTDQLRKRLRGPGNGLGDVYQIDLTAVLERRPR